MYSTKERFWLWGVAAVVCCGLNGTFFYGLFFAPGALSDALKNPISVAFIAEAFILLGVLAYLLKKWGVLKISVGWFVFLSIVGGLGFALPLGILWLRRTGSSDSA
jgi:hypothetical protein